jgi:hypothetical protein
MSEESGHLLAGADRDSVATEPRARAAADGGGGDEQPAWASMYVHLPEDASLLDKALFPARVQLCYLRRLAAAFSWRYVLAVCSVYGVSQGIGSTFYYFAFDFYVADNLRLSPSRAGELYGLAHVPWELKPLFGMISDAFPIGGLRRGPYIVIYSVLGGVAILWVGVQPGITSVGLVGVLFWVYSLANAGPDVMVDATVAERTATFPALASDVQSLTWGAKGVFAMLAGLLEGSIVGAFGARGVFRCCAALTVLVATPAALGWLKETRTEDAALASGARPTTASKRCGTLRSIMASDQQAPVFQSSLLVACFSLFLGILAVFGTEETLGPHARMLKSAIVLVCAPLIAVVVYFTLRRCDEQIARIGAFLYLRYAVCPTTRVMFYWYHEDARWCGGGGGDSNGDGGDAVVSAAVASSGEEEMVVRGSSVRKRLFCAIGILKPEDFTKTGSGQI